MAERRAKGLCYNCDGSYSAGHRCKRFFCLMVEDSDGMDEFSAESEISLRAITGPKTTQTMQLKIWVAGKLILGLVDSGSTHYFISEEAALRLRLPISHRSSLQVAVENSEKKFSPGICIAFPLRNQDQIFYLDLYVITLGIFDVVLGVKWLQMLGPILWDEHSYHEI